MTAPKGLAIPSDWKDGPNCGVLAVAVAANKPFQYVYDVMAINYTRAWRGRTQWDHDIVPTLIWLGVRFSGVDLNWYGNPPCLWQFANAHRNDDVLYVLDMPGHIATLKNGYVLDQKGARWFTQCRNQRLDHVLKIIRQPA